VQVKIRNLFCERHELTTNDDFVLLGSHCAALGSKQV
jgi:hypothetical protein